MQRKYRQQVGGVGNAYANEGFPLAAGLDAEISES